MRKVIKFLLLIVCTSILVELSTSRGALVMALPPEQDLPEEILRTQIITTARSPVDGKPLTAGEYAQLQAQLQKAPPPKLAPRIQDQVFLIRLRKTLLQLFPFLDI
ncbi:glutathione S-transferase [Brasilonema sp. CT11]|nr:glutathione S-transferase [Brasilonema sp. CT11]